MVVPARTARASHKLVHRYIHITAALGREIDGPNSPEGKQATSRLANNTCTHVIFSILCRQGNKSLIRIQGILLEQPSDRNMLCKAVRSLAEHLRPVSTVPAIAFDFGVLPQHVEAKLLGQLQIVDEGLVSSGRVQAIRPEALNIALRLSSNTALPLYISKAQALIDNHDANE